MDSFSTQLNIEHMVSEDFFAHSRRWEETLQLQPDYQVRQMDKTRIMGHQLQKWQQVTRKQKSRHTGDAQDTTESNTSTICLQQKKDQPNVLR